MITKDAYAYVDYAMGHNPENRMPLWIKPAKKVTVKNVADVMRDHYEGTPLDMTTDIGAGGNAIPYRWRPMDFEYNGKTYTNERAIATQQTGSGSWDSPEAIFLMSSADSSGSAPMMRRLRISPRFTPIPTGSLNASVRATAIC